jgi:hypothetical protein
MSSSEFDDKEADEVVGATDDDAEDDEDEPRRGSDETGPIASV